MSEEQEVFWRAAKLGIREAGAMMEDASAFQLSALSSPLTHELRTPLSSVKMAIQTLLRNPELPERDRRRLSIANREVRTMERMLSLFAEYGRDTPGEVERHPLRALVEEAAMHVEPELAERQVQVTVHESAPHPYARADRNRLRPVLAQLLLNVAQGLSPGSILDVLLNSGDNSSTVEVRDLNASLPQGKPEVLFVPFGARMAGAPGLSWAALRHILRGAGGEVTAEALEKGILYHLTFQS